MEVVVKVVSLVGLEVSVVLVGMLVVAVVVGARVGASVVMGPGLGVSVAAGEVEMGVRVALVTAHGSGARKSWHVAPGLGAGTSQHAKFVVLVILHKAKPACPFFHNLLLAGSVPVSASVLLTLTPGSALRCHAWSKLLPTYPYVLGVILGLYWGYIGVILGLYWDNGKKMETTIVHWGLYRDNGKENGNYYSILGLYEP